MIQLLLVLKVAFLILPSSVTQFALKIKSSEPVHLPLKYKAVHYVDPQAACIYSGCVTQFEGDNPIHHIKKPKNCDALFGDRNLFEELKPSFSEYRNIEHCPIEELI